MSDAHFNLLLFFDLRMKEGARRDVAIKAASRCTPEQEERVQALVRGGFIRLSAARCGPLALPDPDTRFVSFTEAGRAYMDAKDTEKAAPPIDTVSGAV